MRLLSPLLILITTIFVICYLAVGVPKLFTIMAPEIAQELGLSIVDFSKFLYSSGQYSLVFKVIFSFLFNSRKFTMWVSLYWLYFLVVVAHFFSLLLCTSKVLNLHMIGRYTQGAFAGILLVLLEPVIVNFSPDFIKKKLLHLKYEFIALIAPLSILLISISAKWRTILLVMGGISILLSIFILLYGKKDRIIEKIDPHLFSNFCKSLINPSIFVDSVVLGSILGIFLILFQYHFIRTFGNIWGIKLAIMQGLPFTLALIISKINPRNIVKTFVIVTGMVIAMILLFAAINNTNISIFPYNTMVFMLVNSLYALYVLFTPDTICSMINNNPQFTAKSILTASQLLRSITTVFVTTNLNILHKKSLGKTYYIFVLIFIIINILFFTNKKYKANNIKGLIMVFFILFNLTILYFLRYLC